MEKIEFTTATKIGGEDVTSISVAPLTFIEFAKLWGKAEGAAKPMAALQRARITHQTHFKAGDKRLRPTDEDLSQLPIPVAKAILKKLDDGQGEMGEVISAGDGATKPILYRLGTPIELKDSKGAKTAIEELEFQATTYAEIEDVLAAPNEVEKAEVLLRALAVPVGVSNLMRLPGWALDKITMADGVGVMRFVSPSF